MADNPNKTEKTDKANKLKARLPRGLADRGPAEIAATRRMLDTIRGVYERYGFEPVETPMFEYADALGKFLPYPARDRAPPQIAATRRRLDTIRGVYERYGFEPVETPMFEYADALGKFLPDQDPPNEGVFSFQDGDALS